ncbi:hypothetical protein [Agrobacterium tumefaciens]|uniref:hypothetical protein n=1 Tax=Agrobacterium tumefaciens TaxID=358 RepID=UPI001ADAC21F|nr:hypothetical protein [Agrobacterium tumefaciens]
MEAIKKALEELRAKIGLAYDQGDNRLSNMAFWSVDLEMVLSTLESLQRENEELREDRDRTARNRDMYKGQVERQAVQIEDFRSETKRLQVGVYVETIPAVHLIRVFADDMNERNWDDKRAYIKQQADRIRTALASTGGEHHADNN